MLSFFFAVFAEYQILTYNDNSTYIIGALDEHSAFKRF